MNARQRRARGLLLVAFVGIAVTTASGLALVPRVKAVEVITLVAAAIGAGAALTQAVADFRQARVEQAPTAAPNPDPDDEPLADDAAP